MSMAIRLGETAPDFVAESTRGMIRFREWKHSRWCMLFSHCADFTPVGTTELAAVAALMPEFEKRDVLVLSVSVDPLDSHYRWLSEIERIGGTPVSFPIAEDPNRWIASLYGIVDPSEEHRRTVRAVFLVDPDDRVRLMMAYPPSTGCSFAEVLRVIDSLQSPGDPETADDGR
jgi:thioredoxin-dependent peroxiredoxin